MDTANSTKEATVEVTPEMNQAGVEVLLTADLDGDLASAVVSRLLAAALHEKGRGPRKDRSPTKPKK